MAFVVSPISQSHSMTTTTRNQDHARSRLCKYIVELVYMSITQGNYLDTRMSHTRHCKPSEAIVA